MTRQPGVIPGDPSHTRKIILAAALEEFSENGLGGARIERIARAAGVNKQALYYHFGSKEQLYQATLEYGYESLRIFSREFIPEAEDPPGRMRELVGYFFDTMERNRPVVWLVSEENRMRGRHLAQTPGVRSMTAQFVLNIAEIYRDGVARGDFRDGIEPEQLWLTIVSICYLYFANIYTLSHIIDRDLDSPDAIQARREHVMDFILRGIENPTPAEHSS